LLVYEHQLKYQIIYDLKTEKSRDFRGDVAPGMFLPAAGRPDAIR
jgi:hypothetical protein